MTALLVVYVELAALAQLPVLLAPIEAFRLGSGGCFWCWPRIIIVDAFKTQLKCALFSLQRLHMHIHAAL